MDIPSLKKTICSIVEITEQELISKSKKQQFMFARFLFAYYAYSKCGNKQKIAEELNRDESTINYYLEQYDSIVSNSKVFKSLISQIETSISNHV